MDSQIIIILLGLVTTYFAIRWQASAAENSKLKDKLSEKKSTLYNELIDFLFGIIQEPSDTDKTLSKERIEKLKKYHREIITTASNEVLLTYGDLMQSIYLEPENLNLLLRLLGELVISIREDLGHGTFRNKLAWFDILRPSMRDISEHIPKKFRKLRRVYTNFSDLNPLQMDHEKNTRN